MPKALWFTDDPKACELIAQDPFALLVGFAIDQQVTVMKAFAGPLVLKERAGTLEPKKLAKMHLAPLFAEATVRSASAQLVLNDAYYPGWEASVDGRPVSIEAANVALDEAYAQAEQDNVRAGQYVMVAVSDTGAGMPPDVQRHLFESFYSTKEQGLGMGLVIVRSIVERHRGRVSASNGERGGAVFRVVLPKSPAQVPA